MPKIETNTNQQPLLALPGPTYVCDFAGGIPVGGHVIKIRQEGGQGRGTAWSVWNGAVALLHFLNCNAGDILSAISPSSSVLELGSGTGLAGLAAAAALKRAIIVTDVLEALPALRRNVYDLNDSSISSIITVKALDWNQVASSPSKALDDLFEKGSSPIGLILAADCVWLEDLVAPFVETLKQLVETSITTHPNDSPPKILMAYQSRSQRVDDLLFSLLEQADFVVQTARPPAANEPHRGLIDIYWIERFL